MFVLACSLVGSKEANSDVEFVVFIIKYENRSVEVFTLNSYARLEPGKSN